MQSLPLPSRRYVIWFTPRSGSTRLTDILNRAGGLSNPGEIFNPNYLGDLAAHYGARDLADYIDIMMRERTTNGTFGCEITLAQLYYIFFSERQFFKMCQPTSTILLIRENILEQAFSFSRMAQTGFSHRISPSDPTDDDLPFRYDSDQISDKLHRVLQMEREYERIISSRKLQSLRLSYETLIDNGLEIYVPVIADHVGAKPYQVHGLESVHQKISDERNLEYARRFGIENTTLLRRVATGRAGILDALAAQQGRYLTGQSRGGT